MNAKTIKRLYPNATKLSPTPPGLAAKGYACPEGHTPEWWRTADSAGIDYFCAGCYHGCGLGVPKGVTTYEPVVEQQLALF